jgi:hypothetical protein
MRFGHLLDYQLINNNFMGVENDVTKKIAQLEENKDVAGLEEVKNDAEAGFDGETVGLVEQAIARLNNKVEKITPPVETTEGQKTQVGNMGGSESGLQEVTAPVDEKIAEKDAEIKNVEVETEQKIKELENQGGFKINSQGKKYEFEKNGTYYGGDYLQEPPQEINIDTSKLTEGQEKVKELETEISGLLDQISSNLPNQLSELYNSEPYKKLVDLNEKRKVEEKSLWESYDRYTKGGDGSHRRVNFTLGEYGEQVQQYVDDLKFFNAPKDLLKRFEEYKEKFKTPENNAQEKFKTETLKPLNEVRWDFEKTLVSKSEETFGKDLQGAKDFQKKFFSEYENNLNKAKQDTIPDKKTLHQYNGDNL